MFSGHQLNKLEVIQQTLDNVFQRIAVDDELTGSLVPAFPVRQHAKRISGRRRGRPHATTGFFLTCLDKPMENINCLRHDTLRAQGLGM